MYVRVELELIDLVWEILHLTILQSIKRVRTKNAFVRSKIRIFVATQVQPLHNTTGFERLVMTRFFDQPSQRSIIQMEQVMEAT